jgi:hypothetical protein
MNQMTCEKWNPNLFRFESHYKMIDFISLGYSQSEQEMLEDAYEAIETTKMWDYMKKEPVGGYTFTDDEELRLINRHLEYDGHSGFSFGWTMRTMQQIARLGEEKFIEECLTLKNVSKRSVNG